MSSSELYEEIGRLKQQVDDLNEITTALRERNETLDEANMTMHDELAKANRALRRDGIEKGRLNDDLRRLNEEMEMQNEEIEGLHDQLSKAQRTIKVQSDQIAAPNEKKTRWTPSRGKYLSRPDVDSSGPPPQFKLPQSFSSSMSRAQQMMQTGYPPTTLQQPLYHQQHSSQSGYPPPLPVQHSSQPSTTQQLVSLPPPHSYTSQSYHQSQRDDSRHQRQQYETAKLVSRSSIGQLMIGSGPGPTIGDPSGRAIQLYGQSSREKELYEFRTPSGVFIETRQEDRAMSLVPDLSPLFFQGEAWARRYCGVPSKANDAAMPLELKAHIATLTNPDEVQHLLSKTPTRPLIIAKLINHSITTTCLHPTTTSSSVSVITGFRPSIDHKLASLYSRSQTPTSATVTPQTHHALLTATVELIKSATEDPHFASWVDRQADRHTARTWSTLLAPLCVAETNVAEAQAGLEEIWKEAFRVGVKMACKPSRFMVEFPSLESLFDGGRMVDREVVYGDFGSFSVSGEGEGLGLGLERVRERMRGRGEGRVRLAVTPLVMEVGFEGTGDGEGGWLEPRCLHFSNCLVRYSDEE